MCLYCNIVPVWNTYLTYDARSLSGFAMWYNQPVVPIRCCMWIFKKSSDLLQNLQSKSLQFFIYNICICPFLRFTLLFKMSNRHSDYVVSLHTNGKRCHIVLVLVQNLNLRKTKCTLIPKAKTEYSVDDN